MISVDFGLQELLGGLIDHVMLLRNQFKREKVIYRAKVTFIENNLRKLVSRVV